MPAYFLVQRWVNQHLEGQVAPHLLYDLERSNPALQIVPKNLLSARCGSSWHGQSKATRSSAPARSAVDGLTYRTVRLTAERSDVSSARMPVRARTTANVETASRARAWMDSLSLADPAGRQTAAQVPHSVTDQPRSVTGTRNVAKPRQGAGRMFDTPRFLA